MKYTVIISPRAVKEINKLRADIREKVGNAIEDLSVNPFEGKALKAQLSGLYSYRVGNYRIIYDIIKHKIVIEIIKVMHRRDVYR